MTDLTESLEATDARSRLAAAIAERDTITAGIADFNAQEKLLISAASTDAAAESELAALDHAASGALSEWARSGGKGEPPNPDGARREELLKRAARAQARARAADGARAKLNNERNVEARKLHALESQIGPLVLDVLGDEVAPFVGEFKKLAAAAGELAWKVVAFKSVATEMAHGAKEEARGEFFARLPSIIESLEGISPPPSPDDSQWHPHRDAWLALASRLRAGNVESKLHLEA